jgi:hypothetical protein
MRVGKTVIFVGPALSLFGCKKADEPAIPVGGNRASFGEQRDVDLGGGKVIVVQGSIFSGGGKDGDFDWMIQQPKYAKTLFVFNDNEEQFTAFMKGNLSAAGGCGVGGGNAVIRPFQCKKPPQAQGVSTGSHAHGGYNTLDGKTKAIIDAGIKKIRNLVTTGNYDRVLFSQNRYKKTLGSGIFDPSDEVKDYIFNALLALDT